MSVLCTYSYSYDCHIWGNINRPLFDLEQFPQVQNSVAIKTHLPNSGVFETK